MPYALGKRSVRCTKYGPYPNSGPGRLFRQEFLGLLVGDAFDAEHEVASANVAYERQPFEAREALLEMRTELPDMFTDAVALSGER